MEPAGETVSSDEEPDSPSSSSGSDLKCSFTRRPRGWLCECPDDPDWACRKGGPNPWWVFSTGGKEYRRVIDPAEVKCSCPDSCEMTLQRRLWVFKGKELIKEDVKKFDPRPGRCVWMGEGPKPEGRNDDQDDDPINEGDKCGPDVTLPLVNTLTRIRSVFDNWGDIQKGLKCLPVVGYLWGNAWEIEQLHSSPFNYYHIDSVYCANNSCTDTVTVDDKCFHSWAVNYVIFGLMSRLCARGFLPAYWADLLAARGIVWFYNTAMSIFDPNQYHYGDNSEKEPWVEAGFYYWPAYPTPAAPSSTGSCEECPLPSVPERIFNWHWDGYYE